MRIPTATCLLALLSCFMHLCSSHVFVVSALCLGDQRSLLLNFKDELEGVDSSTKLRTWNESIACCEWGGVICDHDGHVIGLDLSGELVVPNIITNSSSLFGLRYLKSLNLAYNYLLWYEVTSEFNKLSNLTYLNLSRAAYFDGSVPIGISQLTRLVTLDISVYIVEVLPEIRDLQKFLQNLTKLRQLHLDGVNVSAQGQEWTDALLKTPSLEELSMSSCKLFGPLQPALAMLENLSVIILDYNNFSSIVPESYGNFKNLTILDVSDCGLIGVFPQKIFQIPTLSFIDISSNGDLHGSFLDFPMNGSLQTLLIVDTNFSGPLPNSIGYLRHLSSLLLDRSQFSGTLPISFSNLTQLVEINLSDNRFFGLIPSLAKCKRLQVVDLSNNNFSGAITNLDLATQFLENQSRITNLDLSNNHITGTIPHWILQLKFLNSLDISNNFLTNWKESLLSNMSNLQILDLHSNHLHGPLPILPPNLVYLDCSSNHLSSGIPPNIGNLHPAIFLSLSSNYLHGNIPESICNASNLYIVDLSNNAFAGKIPQCLISMNGTGTLTILNLKRNKLSGTIDTFPGSCGLSSLQLNGNSLQGKLPQHLVNCTMLQVLDLGDNQIEEEFPCWLKRIPLLRILILRSNKLYGSRRCQETKAGWPLLQIFYISCNNFSGRIPAAFFETWEVMMVGENDERSRNLSQLDYGGPPFEYQKLFGYYRDKVTVNIKEHTRELVKILTIFTLVDLSNNKFEGSIPEDLGQMNALHLLNLSHNAFSGHIPSSLGSLENIESLDLSSNKLSGEIPTELAGLSFLEFLNVSYNHLEGKIPISTQIQSFEAASFEGNDGLCGPPLTPNCSGDGVQGTSPVASSSNKESSIDWNLIAAELGFAFAIGIIVLILVFHKARRIWYWERVDNILYRIFPQLDFVIECRGGQSYRVLRWKPY